MSAMGNESDGEKAADSVLSDQAVQHGMRFARYVFEKRGNNSEVHISEAELAAIMAVSFERGARAAEWQLHPNAATVAAMIEAREGRGGRMTLDEFRDELRGLSAEAEAGTQSTFSLTRRESMQPLDMLEHPRPRSQKFTERMAKNEQWKRENERAIQSSNEYVERNGLPLVKCGMPPKEAEAECHNE
jgi:hypothetical protein